MTLTKQQVGQMTVATWVVVLALWFGAIVVGLPWLARRDRRACIERNLKSGQPIGVAEDVCR